MQEFSGIAPALANALTNRGYSEMTSVQMAVLVPELQGSDLLVSAQTGSGKTVAFGIAIAPTLLEDKDCLPKTATPLALVVAPTRELALQVKRELDWLYADTGASIASCVGGMDIRTERKTLERGAHIVVGTPGRLRDHIMRKALNTADLKAVVLDEADEMLDLGFREDLEFILDTTPGERRTLLFSATVAAPIAKLAKQYQQDAIRITTKEEKQQHGDIEYRALVSAPQERENAIVNVLRYYEAENALVFCNTRAAVNHLVARFNNRGFSVVALSGELSQSERSHALQAMRDGRARVCIATDVAARGIDLPKLDLVVHSDLPSDPETLLHRSGRTGRAGRKGVSALMVNHKNKGRAERLLRFAKIEATWDNPPSASDVNILDEERIFADQEMFDDARSDELEFTKRLLEKYSPQQIATAFHRMSKSGKSAPEDIQKVSFKTPHNRDDKISDRSGTHKSGKNSREFDQSLWVTISVGRKQNAEPRWLIPLICNAGGLSKPDIGYIKIEQSQTHVELDATQADRFLESIGPTQTLEKNVRVKVLKSKPDFGGSANYNKRDKPSEKRFPKPRRAKNKSEPAFHASEAKSGKRKKPANKARKPKKSAKARS
ncbi:MAG: DEAD/DEAH box helicase [Pseudomonadota bacterium]